MPSCRAHGTYGGRSKKDILESRAFGALNWDPLLPRRMRGVLALKGRGLEALDTTGSGAGGWFGPAWFPGGPAGFVGGGHAADCAQVLEFPLAGDLYVVFLVAGGQPSLAVAFAEREGAEEVPVAPGSIAVDLDYRVEDVVLRERDAITEAFEQLANRSVTFMGADSIAFPDAVVGENLYDFVRVVIVVAD